MTDGNVRVIQGEINHNISEEEKILSIRNNDDELCGLRLFPSVATHEDEEYAKSETKKSPKKKKKEKKEKKKGKKRSKDEIDENDDDDDESDAKENEQTRRQNENDAMIAKGLAAMGIDTLFPVQRAVVPASMALMQSFTPADVIVGAPTGCGKTLAYVLSIIHQLKDRVVRRLRALILVPSNDLASQVGQVLSHFCHPHSKLTMAVVSTLTPLQTEKAQLVAKKQNMDGTFSYQSLVDIIVATPGRLIAHLTATEGFHLDDLQFLVVDEVDRLLDSTYSDWVNRIIAGKTSSEDNKKEMKFKKADSADIPVVTTIKAPVRKMLFSATLTRNPEKLAKLQLYQPQIFTYSTTPQRSVEAAAGANNNNNNQEEEEPKKKKYVLPKNLKQYVLLCDVARKPSVLLYLLTRCFQSNQQQSLCFTSSLDDTHKLARLLELCAVQQYGSSSSSNNNNNKNNNNNPIRVAEFSRANVHHHKRILSDYKQGKINVLVCSDVMSRGIDLPNIHNVINYHVPNFGTTYIHRTGRTARAGKEGTAFTFLADFEIDPFRDEILDKIQNTQVEIYPVKQDELQQYDKIVAIALRHLPTVLQQESHHIIKSEEPLPAAFFSNVGGVFKAAAAAMMLEEQEKQKQEQQQQQQQQETEEKQQQTDYEQQILAALSAQIKANYRLK